jgi:hypothetical protein
VNSVALKRVLRALHGSIDIDLSQPRNVCEVVFRVSDALDTGGVLDRGQEGGRLD